MNYIIYFNAFVVFSCQDRRWWWRNTVSNLAVSPKETRGKRSGQANGAARNALRGYKRPV